MARVRRGILLLAVFLLVPACASTGNGERGSRYDRYEISHEEIQEMQGQVNNLYVLIDGAIMIHRRR